MIVLLFPPRAFFNNLVNLESRYGTEIQEKLHLMAVESLEQKGPRRHPVGGKNLHNDAIN